MTIITAQYLLRGMRVRATRPIVSTMIIPRAEDILNRWKRELGGDALAYRNHVHR